MTLPEKPKAGIYVDDSNLYKRGKAAGWMTDYKKLYKWVANLNTVVHARIYMGRPRYEPAKSITKALEEYFKKIGYMVTANKIRLLKRKNQAQGLAK